MKIFNDMKFLASPDQERRIRQAIKECPVTILLGRESFAKVHLVGANVVLPAVSGFSVHFEFFWNHYWRF